MFLYFYILLFAVVVCVLFDVVVVVVVVVVYLLILIFVFLFYLLVLVFPGVPRDSPGFPGISRRQRPFSEVSTGGISPIFSFTRLSTAA